MTKITKNGVKGKQKYAVSVRISGKDYKVYTWCDGKRAANVIKNNVNAILNVLEQQRNAELALATLQMNGDVIL